MWLIVCVFVAVYLGMAVGKIPGLKVDRTGIALLGLIMLLAAGALTLPQAVAAVDVPTLTLLFALMIISAQFEEAGFYAWVAARSGAWAVFPKGLLAVVILVSGVLSALLTNDVVAFALAAPLVMAVKKSGLDARPYLIGLASAANAGSAATLIGNPQNILIGQVGQLSFWGYVALAVFPSLIACALAYLAIMLLWPLPSAASRAEITTPPVTIDGFQITKAVAAMGLLCLLFFTSVPREISALSIAAILLLSRTFSSRAKLASVDWQLLLLFACLFGVTAAFETTGIAQGWLAHLKGDGIALDRLSTLLPLTLISSNSIGNVPAVVMLTKIDPHLSPGVLSSLAMLSTFSGNLLLTGSMCNIIVAEIAQTHGQRLSFGDFMRAGLLMTIPTIILTGLWVVGLGLISW